MKRHKNENEFLAMVGTGEQEILSLISLFQGAEDTKSTIRLKGKKKQFRGASSNSKEKAASGVLYCPMQQTPPLRGTCNDKLRDRDGRCWRLDVSTITPKFHQNKLFRP